MTNSNTKSDPRTSRRDFLRATATAAGGLLVSLYLDRRATAQEGVRPDQIPPQPKKNYPPDAFVRVTPDNQVVIQVNRLEFGQGVHTALPLLLADDLRPVGVKLVRENHRQSRLHALTELKPVDLYDDLAVGAYVHEGVGRVGFQLRQHRLRRDALLRRSFRVEVERDEQAARGRGRGAQEAAAARAR